MDYVINYEKRAYPDLMILCAHDTHHDFFENPDPMKVEIQQGGSKRKSEDISADTEKRIRESIDLSSKRKISSSDELVRSPILLSEKPFFFNFVKYSFSILVIFFSESSSSN